MDKQLLYKMFRGEATEKELAHIRRWVDRSEENKQMFFRERTLFDAIQLNNYSTRLASRRQRTLVWRWVGSIAAALLILFLFHSMSLIQKEDNTEMALNTITVPAGQRIELTLADGTHIWLNSLSEISYPASFNQGNREVYLQGEAFFEVAKDEKKKFIVHTRQCEIEVLGTQFNVEAYAPGEFSAALLRGSVKVTNKSFPGESVVLKPHNVARFDGGKLRVTPLTDLTSYSWKEGLITFKDIGFKDLMKKLEKNYGLRIVVATRRLDGYACSGKFRISDGIDEVLRALQQDARFTFERVNKNEIRIQ